MFTNFHEDRSYHHSDSLNQLFLFFPKLQEQFELSRIFKTLNEYESFSLGEVFFYFFYGYCFIVLIWSCCRLFKLYSFQSVISGILVEIEQEVGNYFDILYYLGLIILSVLGIIGCYHLSLFIAQNIDGVVVFCFLLQLVYISTPPAFLSLLFGKYVLQYLNGQATSSSINLMNLIDYASVFSYISRFIVQLFRYFILWAKCGLTCYFFHDESFLVSQMNLEVLTNSYYPLGLIEYYFTYFMYFIDVIFHYLLELIELFFYFYAQFGMLIVILFWLLKALYYYAWPVITCVWFKYRGKKLN